MNRILSGVVEISTAALTVTSKPPVFTGENGALEVSVSFVMNGAVEDITGYTAEMYLFWAERKEMTEAVQMTVINDTATGSFGDGLTAQAGSPLLVIQLTDSGTGALIVACAQPVQISATRGEVVLTTRPPTPSEIVYVGRAPYINTLNNNWMIWDNDSGSYVDSGVGAVGTPNVGSVQGKTGSVVLYGTDIALSTSDSTKLTTAIANAGQVETVAGVGVATGTKNVPLTGADLPVSSSDTTKVSTKLSTLETGVSVMLRECIEVLLPNVSDSSRTYSVEGIRAAHKLVNDGFALLSNPAAAGSDLTLTTADDGTITVGGTLTGTTNIKAAFCVKPATVTGTAT